MIIHTRDTRLAAASTFWGNMSFSWITLLLHLFLLPTLGYKLQVPGNAHLSSVNGASLLDPARFLSDKAIKFEWETSNKAAQGPPILFRVKREDSTDDPNILDSSSLSNTNTPRSATFEKVPTLPDTTQSIIQTTSTPEEFTPSSEMTTNSLNEDETSVPPTTNIDNSMTKVPTEVFKDISSSGKFKSVIFSTTSPYDKVGDLTSALPSNSTSNLPVVSSVTLKNQNTVADDKNKKLPDTDTTTIVETNVTASPEHAPPLHSLMKQCMLAILILGVICTIFIISTIALAAKLSTLKHHRKKQRNDHTEMMCISTLLPESDQQSRVKLKKLRTFAANVEESDGDNTTLNSFLPDH